MPDRKNVNKGRFRRGNSIFNGRDKSRMQDVIDSFRADTTSATVDRVKKELSETSNFKPSLGTYPKLDLGPNPQGSYQPDFKPNGNVPSMNSNRRQGDFSSVADAAANYQTDVTENGRYKVTPPNLDEGDDGGNGFDYGELSGYIIPGLDSIISAKQANKFYDDSKLDFKDASFRYGQVQDLAKPNFAKFAKSAKVPLGSSLAEANVSEKFGDIAQRGQEANYELQNSASRIAQRQNINKIANAETQFNAQQNFAADGFNAKVAATRGATKDARAQDALIGLTQNIQSGSAQRSYTKNSNKMQTAAALIRKGEIEKGMKLAGF